MGYRTRRRVPRGKLGGHPESEDATRRSMSDKIKGQQWEVFRASAIVVSEDTDSVGNRRITPCSGFLVDLDGQWIWITAGHCIDFLDQRLEAGTSPIVMISLPWDAKGPIHLDYKSVLGISFNTFTAMADHSQGTWTVEQREIMRQRRFSDLGFIVFRERNIQHLRKAGAVPFQREQIRLYEPNECDGIDPNLCHFFIFGVPLNSVDSVATPENPTYRFKALGVRGSRNADGTPCEPDGVLMFFDPAWPATEHQGSVNGMSGGPVVLLGWDRPVVVGVLKEEAGSIEVAERNPASTGELTQLRAVDSGKLLGLIETLLAVLIPR